MKRLILSVAFFLAGAACAAGVITDVRFQSTGAGAQASVPVTFGQVFAVGDMKKSDVLVGKLDGAAVPLQVDVKATHADGSVRHAIISAIVPKLAAGATGTMTLATGGAVVANAVKPADLLAAGFTASASATIAGVKYSASADQLLKGATSTWLAGAVANEWQVSAPLTTAAGVAHQHLQARFAVRYYSAVKKARVDVTIENAWAYEPGPQNFTYDADVSVGGKSVYSKPGLVHFHHARWRKMFWWGDAPAINVQSNVAYLIASRAVPNYDQSFGVAPSLLSAYGAAFSAAPDPMTIGIATDYMPTTGAHNDIGLLPMWSVAHILSMDQRAHDAALFTADGAGSFSVHYRDKSTGLPVTLASHPNMTIAGRPSDAGADAFPAGVGDGTSPYTADVAHQPSFAFYPYLITGDYFYLEELQFWGMWNLFNSNPNYRGYGKGLLISEQIRGQAWGLRTLAQVGYVTPDTHPLKAEFLRLLSNNLDWYNTEYSNNAAANKLGIIVNGYAFYNNNAVGPWQDDFFTSAAGYAVDLGFNEAKPLLDWKAKFPVGRMTAPGYCWMDGSPYIVTVRDGDGAPIYDTFAQVETATRGADFAKFACGGADMAKVLGQQVGDMGNISNGIMGYPSNMQPALAYAVDSGIAGGAQAWALFMGRTVKPDYSVGSQFSVVPRGAAPVVAPPSPKPGIITAPTSTKLAKLTGLMVVVLEPATRSEVLTAKGVAAKSTGAFTLADAALIANQQYVYFVFDAKGILLVVNFITAT